MADETTLTYLMSNFVKASYEADNHFADARAKFKELKSQCQNSTSLDLLIQANHLGMTTSIFDKILRRNIPFESLMASLYASYLQEHPFQIVTKDNARYCDGLLYDLEPLVAGWLLYDLCKDMKPEIIRRAFSFSGYFFDVPSISNIGSKNGFVCAWDQMGGSLAMPSKLSYRYTYFDFSKNDPFKEKILSRSPFVQPNQSLPIRQCTLSEDGGYMLLVSGLEQSNVSLYNLSNPEYAGKGQSEGVVPVCSFPVEHSINDIVTALFDNTTGNFNIIARSPSVPGNVKAKTTFYYYSLLPHSKSLQEHGTADCPAILNCDAMQWSCINGEFVGVYQDQKSKDRHVVVRNNNELIMCLFDQENQQWYPAEGNKKKLNFQVINAAASKAGTIEKQHAERAIQDSFIPNFQYCLSHNLSKNLHAHYLKFDATHLCTYFVSRNLQDGSPEVGVLYPFDQKLTIAINILNKRVSSDQKQVLVDTFFLDRFYRKPESWESECENILQPQVLLSEEIQELYNVNQLLETKKLASLSWMQAWEQKKFWAYVQQKWQSFYNQYKKPLWGSLILGGTGLTAWYLAKHGKANWFSSPKPKKLTPSWPFVSTRRQR
jgi:hypothetical protein